MNSAALPDTTRLPLETSPWEDVRRIYRRMCVLRALGRVADASMLEHRDLARALAAARLASENAAEEAAVFAREEDRVATAEVLADLVAPRIAEQLRSEVAPIAAAAPHPPTPAPSPVASAPAEPAEPVATPARPPAGDAPGIADFIDSMLAQERTPAPRGR